MFINIEFDNNYKFVYVRRMYNLLFDIYKEKIILGGWIYKFMVKFFLV